MNACRRCKGAATREIDFAWWCDGCLVAHLVSTATLLKGLLEQDRARQEPTPLEWREVETGCHFVRESGRLRQSLVLTHEGVWAWMLGWWRDDYGCSANVADGRAKTREAAEAELVKVTAEIAHGARRLGV